MLSDAQVTLSFYIDPQKLVVMKGQVQVDVELDCQRCGEPFKQTSVSYTHLLAVILYIIRDLINSF